VNTPAPNFGKYWLIAELGRGGMATVYLALAESGGGLDFNKLVVIKRLRDHIAADPEFVIMLQDEARLAARLNHQNVVQTLEVGEIHEQVFLAMEFLDGQPFHRIRKRGGAAFTRELQLTILCDVLTGMHYAHELKDFDGAPLKIVHRDITPQNIFVTYDGQVKVLDFGIAKAEGRSSTTKHGVVKGKLAYMAPEQARGEGIDRRTDIYCLGILLFEAATGQRFWEGLGDSEMLRALIKGTPPRSPRERVAEVDEQLDAICRKALAPDPDDRYATAEEMEIELEEYMQAKSPRVRPRVLGAWLSELFAANRKMTREIVEEQINVVRAKPSTQIIVPLARTAAARGVDVDVDVDVDEDGYEQDEDSDISSNETRLVTSPAQLPAPPVPAASMADLVETSPSISARSARAVRLAIFATLAVVALAVLAATTFTRAHGADTPPSASPVDVSKP
jgi:serine/threonine protein kinase